MFIVCICNPSSPCYLLYLLKYHLGCSDQPSYYHFHIHAVATSHDGGLGQAAGKAFLLSNIISQLEAMGGDGEEAGFDQLDLTYSLGEESELWQNVFAKLKEEKNKG